MDSHYQKMITSNKTQLTIVIAYLTIYEGISLNIAQKNRFDKVLELAQTKSKDYISSNRKLIFKELLDLIDEQNTQMNLTVIQNEAEIFGLLFLSDV